MSAAEPCRGYFCPGDAMPGGRFCTACEERAAAAVALFSWNRT